MVHRFLQYYWKAIISLHLVASLSKCNLDERDLRFAIIWFSAKLSYTSVGNLYWWVDVYSARQAVPGCSKQKHGTGSGGGPDQQRWEILPPHVWRVSQTLLLTSPKWHLGILTNRAQTLLRLLWRMVRHWTCCSLCGTISTLLEMCLFSVWILIAVGYLQLALMHCGRQKWQTSCHLTNSSAAADRLLSLTPLDQNTGPIYFSLWPVITWLHDYMVAVK